MSEIKVNSIKGVNASSPAISINSSDGTCTANITSNGGSQISNRNVIINGSMIVDQRNGGSSITPADTDYTCDRWRYTASQASKFNVQQLSTSPPTGFLNYLKFTVASAVTVGTNDYFAIEQRIEGQNVTSRFGLGTANSKVLKLSFHVKSSLQGTFGGAIRGAGFSRTHPFNYTISSADWEKKTVTIAADTSGSYSTNNTTALGVLFSLGAGSGKSGTAGAWTASDLFSATGAVSVVGTGSATFEITGVQLEEVVATDFEHRSFADELIRCKRYFEIIKPGYFNLGRFDNSSGQGFNFIQFQATKRNSPTASTSGTFRSSSGYSGNISFDSTTVDGASIYTANSTSQNGILYIVDDNGDGTMMLKFDAEL